MMRQHAGSLLRRSPWTHTSFQVHKSTSRLLLSSLSTSQPIFISSDDKNDFRKAYPNVMFSTALTTHHLSKMYLNGKPTQVYMIQIRGFRSGRRDLWNRPEDLMSKVKTGALVLLGTGALVASTSLACGFIITGAAGFGLYTLYQKFRTRVFSDVFRREPRDLTELFSSRRRNQTSSYSQNDPLDQLLTEVPVLIRPILRGIFSLVGGAMEQSMERVTAMHHEINQRLEYHPRIADTVGNDVKVSAPTQWSESSVNGEGTIHATFPVAGSYLVGHVQAHALIDARRQLTFRSLTFRNMRSKEKIDLLNQNFRSFRGNNNNKGRIMDAEYTER